MPSFRAEFRFYEELNDFLPAPQRKRTIEYRFDGTPGIKDPIEAMGIPHTEIELILVNGQSVGFDYKLKDGDRVAVYPVFENLDISPLIRLREKPLRKPAFVVDVNLGKLARWLRLLGFDTVYHNPCTDDEVARISAEEHRILLTRDRLLLHRRIVTHGYFVRSDNVEEQVKEVIRRLDLGSLIQRFQRCLNCNGIIEPVAKEKILDQLKPLTRRYYDEFFRCQSCGKVYWQGPHYQHMLEKLGKLQ